MGMRGIWQKLSKYIYPLIAAFLMTAVISTGVLQRLDTWAQDSLFQHPGVASGDIVIIAIDDEAFSVFGPYYTWDRNIMAAALEALAADPDKKPAVTAIDVLYAGNTSQQPDDRLTAAAQELGNVVTASMAEFGEEVVWDNGRIESWTSDTVINYLQPYEELRECTVQGHINAMSDVDGVLRHSLLYVNSPYGLVNSMPYEAALIYMEQRGKSIRAPRTDRKGYYYVPYTAKPGGYFDGVSIAWLINGDVPADYWADKIVLIGPYAPALQDAYFTSIDHGRQMYGVEFQANIIQSMLEGNFKTDVPDYLQLITVFLTCFIAVLLYGNLLAVIGGIASAGFCILGPAASAILYQLGYVTHPLWMPAGTLILYLLVMALRYAQTSRERRALEMEQERLNTELDLAASIQANSLPSTFPPFPDRKEFDIFASMTPAKLVGGDFYDFFLIDQDHLGLLIADVSGKGIPAALFMMTSMTLIHYGAMGEHSPAKVLTTVNDQLYARNPEGMFVTVWFGILQISTGVLTAANAGHEYPAMCRPDGHFELIKDRHGIYVGAMEGIAYKDQEFLLEPGMKVFVYTDGVAEATNTENELFGTDRMIEALRSRDEGTPEQVLQAVNQAVQAFVGAAPQFDDLTMLCLQYNGPA